MRTRRFLSLLSLLFLLTASRAVAQSERFDIEDADGHLLSYEVVDDTAVMLIYNERYASFGGSLTVPSRVQHCIDGQEYPVTKLGPAAFYNCTGLTAITLPNSVTHIGAGAFSGCSNVESITLPVQATMNTARTFYDCSKLTSISLPDGLTYIGESAFEGCTSLASISLPDGLTAISNAAFYDCSSLTSISLPDGLTAIGESAFEGCSSLSTISIPNSVTSIGGWAFEGCTSLASISLPDGITSICREAFKYCSSLASISLPDGITSIDNKAFSYCTSLTTVTFNGTIPPSLGGSAFYGLPSTAIAVIPDGSLTAYQYAGYGSCFSNIEDITVATQEYDDGLGHIFSFIPLSETTAMIVRDTRYQSYSSDLTIPAIVSGGGNNYTVTAIKDTAFFYCTSLASITLPDEITYIGGWAFYGCTSLTSISLPDGLTYISNYAFGGCSSLASISLPDGLTYIDDAAFIDCSSLASISLPASVTSIGWNPFAHCSALESISVEAGNPVYDSRGGCNAIIHTATNSLISGCKNTLVPNSVTYIDYDAFSRCSNLASISLPDDIISIGDGAFSGCSSLASISLPNGLTYIGYNTFQDCSSLASISLPDGITFIGDNAFYSCSSLATVTFTSTVPPSLGGDSFSDLPADATVTVPCGRLEAYQNEPDYSNYFATITTTSDCPCATSCTREVVSTDESYTWTANNETYTESGEYTATFTNAAGCDSVVTLHLTIGSDECETTFGSLDATACDSYTWELRNETYSESGEYYDTVGNVAGCDSIITLNLTVNYANTGDTTAAVCDTYDWYEHTSVTESSEELTHTFTNTDGCDSVVTLHLTIRHSTENRLNLNECDSYYWELNDSTYTESATDTYTLTNSEGCDSVVALSLTIGYVNGETQTTTACDQYHWELNDSTYTESTTDTYTLTNSEDCDSIVTLDLTINHSNTGTDYQTACDQYTWIDGQTYTASNITATHTLTNAGGCDSIVTLHLTLGHSNEGGESVAACDRYTWPGNGVTYSRGGTITARLTNSEGCDSLATLRLTIGHSNRGGESITACDSYTWTANGETYTASGSHTAHLTNAEGCDSLATLTLTIRYSNEGGETTTACDKYYWNGTLYEEGGTFSAHLLNRYGCDSLATLRLTIRHSSAAQLSENRCDSYTWELANRTYSASGEYVHQLTNSEGCDSLVALRLTIRHSSRSTDTQERCYSYTWPLNGETYAASTHAPSVTLANGEGCDSIVALHLTIRQAQHSVESRQVCPDALPYRWSEHATFETAGSQTITTSDQYGCDSTAEMHLAVGTAYSVDVSRRVCESSLPYYWNGLAFLSAGTQSVALASATGCDSIVNMTLITAPSYDIQAEATVCDNALPYDWHGRLFRSSGSRTAMLLSSDGCDSTVTLTVRISPTYNREIERAICESSLPYAWGDILFHQGGTVVVEAHTADGCDSTTTLTLRARSLHEVSVSRTVCEGGLPYVWDGRLFTETGTKTYTLRSSGGCDSTVHMTLYTELITSVEEVSACDSYTWHGATYSEDTQSPTFRSRTAAGCDSLTTLHLTLRHSSGSREAHSACDSYTWRDGIAYTADNHSATLRLVNAAGCDSIITLDLEMRHSTQGIDRQSACESYTWRDGVTYTADTREPTVKIVNAQGCDSLLTLHLAIKHGTAATEYATACDGYVWHGVLYTRSTQTPTWRSLAANGCDSITTLHLTIGHAAESVETVEACDQYTWHGMTFRASTTTATFRTASSLGCDSTVTLHLVLGHSNSGYDRHTACDTFTWVNHIRYTASNRTAQVTQTNSEGCDSVATLQLTIRRSTAGTETATACDSYTWPANGTTYTASTRTPTHLSTNAAGCDSTTTLHLTINRSASAIEEVSACDQYQWHGHTLRQSTQTPTYHTVTSQGCDSAVTLHLTLGRTVSAVEQAEACESYRWHGRIYTASTYGPTFTTIGPTGCDSTLTLDLTIKHRTNTIERITACNHYAWHGHTYTNSVIGPTFTATGSNGCDSTVMLDLTIAHESRSTQVVAACDSYTWIDGNTYTQSTSAAHHTMTAASGCDSIITLHLSLRHSSRATDIQSACDSLRWIDGNLYTANTYAPLFTIANAAGCDSIVNLHLSLRHGSRSYDTHTACDQYTWIDGRTYSESTAGDAAPTFRTVNHMGCDSVIALRLILSRSSQGTETATACDFYTWQGATYRSSATDSRTLRNAAGCDSVATLRLSINRSKNSIEEVAACDSYRWHGNTYRSSTTSPHYTTTAANGCDSTVALHLTIGHTHQAIDERQACDSLRWHGTLYRTSTDSPTFTTFDDIGCDSTVTLHLTIARTQYSEMNAESCGLYQWHGHTYNEGGVYEYRTRGDNGCDLVETLHLTLLHSLARSETVEACDSYTWQGITFDGNRLETTYSISGENGCDTVVSMLISIYHSDTTHETAVGEAPYAWNGNTYNTGGQYVWQGHNRWGCDSTAILHLTITEPAPEPPVTAIDEANGQALSVYPNPTSGPLAIAADAVRRVEVFDLRGRLVALFGAGNHIDLSRLPEGVYTLRITTGDGETTCRVVKTH